MALVPPTATERLVRGSWEADRARTGYPAAVPPAHASLGSSRRRGHSPLAPLAVLAIAVVVAACSGASGAAAGGGGGSSPAASPSALAALPGWPAAGQVAASGPIPVIASSELVVGANRFLFTVVDQSNTTIASPTMAARVAFYDLARDPATPTATADGRFLWAIRDQRGFYVAPATFAEAGDWGVDVSLTTSGGQPTHTRLRFQVVPKGTTVAVGQKAPATINPTLADVGGNVKRISTDTSPDPSFYRTTVAAALTAHQPFVLIFATPAFCTSRVCGPTLDGVKAVAKQEPGFTFINVEPYKLLYAGSQLQPILDTNNQLQPVQAVDQWGLQAEPWVFVVDKAGIVRGSYEAVVGADELKAAIDAVK